MAIQVSPGINTSEIDLTTVVPSVSTTVGAIAGLFRWGPANQRTLVDSEATLARVFGKPTAYNAETFFTAANFLAYGNALQVVRVVEKTTGNAYNSFANTGGAVSALPVVDNTDSYNATTFDSNVDYVAKYEGELGNSLKISVCGSPSAFSSVSLGGVNISNGYGIASNSTASANVGNIFTVSVGSNVLQISLFGNTTSSGTNTALNTALAGFTVGDIITVGNTTIGTQTLKIASIGTATTVANSTVISGGSNFNATANITLTSTYTLGANFVANTVARAWEYSTAVAKAPGTSNYLITNGYSALDEIHVVVVDAGGKFSGTPGTILEVFANMSRATDAKTDQGATNYYKNILNAGSAYVWWTKDRSGSASAPAASVTSSTNSTPFTANFAGGVDGANESTCSLATLIGGYAQFASSGDVDVSLVLQGKARGSSADSTTVPSSGSTNYSGLANYIITNICEPRKDCVAFVSPARSDVVQTAYGTITDPSVNVVAFRNNINFNSSYAMLDSGYKYQYDKYNDAYVWVPLNGDIGGTCVNTDNVRDPWFSPAGFNRGGIKNVVKLAFNPTKAQRDALYTKDVNPVVSFPGQGAVLYGDKTLIGRPSAFDRINVRRLFIVLEKAISRAAQSSLFEFNDNFTRTQFKNLIDPYLRQIQGRRGITDYRVVCDATNNGSQVIDANQFVGDIYIKPARSINFIQLNFVAVRTGVEFSTVVGQF
jgi:hypothetical protein